MAELDSGQEKMLSLDIEKHYSGVESITVKFEISLAPSKVLILFGPSGAGKTTILRCLSGLESVTNGKIAFGNRVWADSSAGISVSPQERSVGFLFQDFSLFPHLDVKSNVGYGLNGLEKSQREERIKSVCSMLGVLDLMDRKPETLSGGQQQRVALARAVAPQPELLLLDEPFSSLDVSRRELVRSEISTLLRQLKIPALIVTHDWVDALALGDMMMILNKGKVLQTGSPSEVFTKPEHKEVAEAVGVDTFVPARLRKNNGETAVLSVGEASLVALDPGGDEKCFYVCIRGEDVMLEVGAASMSSARNRLHGIVTGILPLGVLTKVFVDVGFDLVALVTRQAAVDLKLARGTGVFAVFKASNVHLIERR